MSQKTSDPLNHQNSQVRVQSCVTEIHQMQIRLRDADREKAEAVSRLEAEKKLSRDLRVENMRFKEDLLKSSTDSDSQKVKIADLRADVQRYVTQVQLVQQGYLPKCNKMTKIK